MAHAALIGELAESLVVSITAKSEDDPSFRRIKEHTVRGLRDATHARTNNFEVKEKLDGLVEKFSVRNRDELADALQSRLDELPTRSKYLPEVLSLLLHLSDKPVDKTDLVTLDGLSQTAASEAELRWEDIVADDPLDEANIWDVVDRGYHSSGDETAPKDELESEPTTSTLATSFAEDDFVVAARQHLVQPELSLLDEIRAAKDDLQKASTDDECHTFSELSVIREVITVLQGLPSYLFCIDEASRKVHVRGGIHIATAEQTTLQSMLQQVVADATQLKYLRQWTTPHANDAKFVQSMQNSTMKLLSKLTLNLGTFAQRYIDPSAGQVVSIAESISAMEDFTKPMVRLSEIIQEAASSTCSDFSFAVLDALYDETCLAHMTGNYPLFILFLDPLLAGVQTYIRLVQQWMQTGNVTSSSHDQLFVLDANTNCELSKVWHDRYVLAASKDGTVNTPKCVQPFVQRIFSSGKARAFLRLLNGSEDGTIEPLLTGLGFLDRTALQKRLDECTLQPFDQLLYDAIDACLVSPDSTGTNDLCHAMLYDHGLLSTLESVNYVYFARDGALFQSLTETLFGRIARSRTKWMDAFMLTELAQDTLGTAPMVDLHLVTLTISSSKSVALAAPVVRQLEQLELAYSLAWPIQNITRSSKLGTHAAAFILLFQVEYCSHLLCPQLFTLRSLQGSGKDLSRSSLHALRLRNQLLWYLNVLRAHATDTCSTLHKTLTKRMLQADGIDAMAAIWSDYEKRLQTSLLLTPKLAPIREAIVGILELCERHAQTISAILEGASSMPTTGDVVDEIDRALSFVVAGLKAVSRAGGEVHLAMLAEKLESNG